jgi:hypothetical protein
MTIIDDTFTRIVLRTPLSSNRDRWVYFRYTDHGDLVDDPLHAHHLQSIDVHLLEAEDHARKYWPNYPWERARLIVDVKPFGTPTDVLNEVIYEQLRRSAKAKLTDHEKKALGL